MPPAQSGREGAGDAACPDAASPNTTTWQFGLMSHPAGRQPQQAQRTNLELATPLASAIAVGR